MLKVTIELLPHGDESRSRILGIATISNDGEASLKTDGELGDYNVSLSKWAPKQSETWKSGRVERFNRLSRGPWDLLYLALRNIVGKRNR